MASTRRKSAAIALAVVGIAGLSLASAATLNVNSSSLAAGVDLVAACDDAVDVDFTTGFAGGAYTVTNVVVSGIDDTTCDGQTIEITVMDSADAVLGSGSTVVDAASESFAMSASAAAVTDVAVVIHG
jgi:hypothetical protein